MKTLLYVTLGALLVCPILAHAQSTNAAPSGPPPEGGPGGPGGPGEWHHGGPDFLTADEKTELKKAFDDAKTADPDLFAQDEALHEKMKAAHDSGEPPDESLMEQGKSMHEQIDAELVKVDPAVAPILAKMKAHHHHGGPGGPGGSSSGAGTPPPDSGT